jgi:NTE family protein
MSYLFSRLFVVSAMTLLVSACASYGVIENETIGIAATESEYSIRNKVRLDENQDLSLFLSFSGGGTRAAALAYGVMLELRDTMVEINGEQSRMLDQVDVISSVSGGSFTSAYYGLHGDGLFETFEDVFLRYDIEQHLVGQVLNPFHWFGPKGRTERAIEYYEKQVFHNATFADMMEPGRPLIVINASDLAHGVRFSFIQEYFDLLCSDLSSYSVARAVTASSAVPVVFNPVVLENYSDCSQVDLSWLNALRQQAEEQEDPELRALAAGLESYEDKGQRKYIHFVDGGITDNIGLRAFYDVITLSGGAEAFMDKVRKTRPSKVAMISIDASTTPVYEMDQTTKQPSIKDSIGAVSGVQLHRYNTATLELMETSLDNWAGGLSAEGDPITPYFIEISIEEIQQPEALQFFNKVPTSFSLTDEQVDRLIKAGRELLRSQPHFQQLLSDLGQ